MIEAALISAGLQAGYGIYQAANSASLLKKLSKQKKARYMDAAAPIQENKAIGERMAKTGLDATTRTIAEQTQASAAAGQYRQFTDMSGGQMSSALGRIGAFNTTQLGQQLGAMNQSAIERGRNIQMMANQQISGLQRADVQQDISYRERVESNLGMAKQQGAMNVLGAVGGFAQSQMYGKYLDSLTGNKPSTDPTIETTNQDMGSGNVASGNYAQPPAYQSSTQLNKLYATPKSMMGLSKGSDFNQYALPSTGEEGQTSMSGGKLYVFRGGKWTPAS
jgi:hypothetical protein